LLKDIGQLIDFEDIGLMHHYIYLYKFMSVLEIYLL
jgi:hypothetical protein